MSKTKIIASFDIGTVNFAEYIEEVDIEILDHMRERYSRLPNYMKRRVKGPMNEEIEDILQIVYLAGKGLHIQVHNFSDPYEKGKLGKFTRKKLFEHLENSRDMFDKCDIFLIEQQYFSTFGRGRNPNARNRGTEANVMMIKFAECLYTWLLINYSDKEIIYFPSAFKTQILGSPEHLTKPQRKKWSVEKAKEILELRKIYRNPDEIESEEFLKNFYRGGKLDDKADTKIQCQAYKFRTYVAVF